MPALRVAAVSAALVAVAAALRAPGAIQCPPEGFSSVEHFDLNQFVKGRWYIHQQMEVPYLPKSRNCHVFADYELRSSSSFWGYDVSVHNHAEDVGPPNKVKDADLCAKIVDADRGQLKVAPCFLPSFLAGPYWVIAYDEGEGYALISGGPPKHAAEGGCRTGTGINDSGLWIFTRQQARDQALVDKVRGIASGKGFDLSVLNDVDQSDACGLAPLN